MANSNSGTNSNSVISGFWEGLKPEPILTVSQWADMNRFLSSEASAEPGRWRTDRTPYLREILDKLSSFDAAEEVIVMKGAQLGFTEAGFNFVGYIMDNSPGPVLYVLPTVEVSKRNSKTRLDPMISATPSLKGKIGRRKSRDADNTTLMKAFPGGTLVMGGANSAATLRNMPVRFLILDELDAYPADLDGEGSPSDLAIKRTSTFSKKKIYKLSTPTTEGASAISSEFMQTDRRYYFVPCPHCGASQALSFKNLKWEEGKPETARMECEHCGELIEERHKTKMLEAGEWIATAKENASPRVFGYHINSLYSPHGWYSWREAADEYEKAKGNPAKMKVFVNTVLGETFKETGDAPAWENLYNRREAYKTNVVPSGGCFITCGVDVQGDRLELELVAWGHNKESWSIDYRVLLGRTDDEKVWGLLGDVISEHWKTEDGGHLPLAIMGIDSGYNTSHVYSFCQRYDFTRVIPLKGKDALANVMVSPPRAVHHATGKKGLKVWQVNTGMIKSEIYGFLRGEMGEEGAPAGYCHFPQYDRKYFRGLASEELRKKKNTKGHWTYEWHKTYERNEPLDCRVYARAAANVLGIDLFSAEHFDKLRANLRSIGEKAPQRPKPKRSGGFWK